MSQKSGGEVGPPLSATRTSGTIFCLTFVDNNPGRRWLEVLRSTAPGWWELKQPGAVL